MSGKYDKILKEILGKSIRVFVRKILGIDAVKITLLDTKMQITNERDADFILKIEERGKAPYISHIEIQSTNYRKMPQRMLLYWLLIGEKYNEYPKQYLFYIGNDPLTMPDHVPEIGDGYKYKIIDFHDIDCEKFINSGKPEEIVISILCNLRGNDVRVMKRLVIQKIRETVADEMLRSKYFRQIQVLSQLKGLDETEDREEEEMLIYDVEKDPFYKRGKMEGELRGERRGELKGLLEGIQLALDIKFGVKGLSLMDKISAVGDLNKLEQIKELIRHSTSVEELENLLN